MIFITGAICVGLSLLIDLALRPAQPPLWAMLMGLIGLVLMLAGLGVIAWKLLP